ncbi:Flp family type IVb pilin [Aurantiacibacter sp. MUD61]|uniref:Flp family type IVb pilin n=1 Tax=Aurantiacibacter sp. MUD61 TaxID=3009083 RepID=UPI0022F0FD23|nr:Flp family type IVb pilin [Aurantiacibacter sp. MUD61]
MLCKFIQRLSKADDGATAVEYGLVAMLIAVAAAGVMLSLGNEVETQYNTIETEYEAANQPAKRG